MDNLGEWNTQLRRGLLELCILCLIAENARYGYEIVTCLSEQPQLAAGEGTIYPLLRRLKKEGLLETFWQESDAGPPRQYYRLTALGRRTLTAMLKDWNQLVSQVNLYVAKGTTIS